MATEERKPVRRAVRLDEPTRYRNHEVYLTDELDNEFFENWNLPKFEEGPLDEFHVVGPGEEGLRGIIMLAHRFYKRPDLWWVLAVANDINLPTRDFVAGMTIRVPARESVYKRLL